MRCCVHRHRWARCRRSAWSRCSAVVTQPVQGPGPRPDRRGTDASAAGGQPASAVAPGVRGRCLDLGPLRRGDQPGTGFLLLGLEALRRPAHRGRLVLPVDHPTRLGPTPGPRRWMPCVSHPPPMPPPPPSARCNAWSVSSEPTTTYRCSCSTLAMTPSPSAPAWLTPGPRSSCGLVPNGSSMPIPPP